MSGVLTEGPLSSMAAFVKRFTTAGVRRGRAFRRICGIVLLLGSTAAVFGAKYPADKEDLRKLASLPPMGFEMNMTFVRGQLRWKLDLVAPDEIAKLKKELHGDSTDGLRLLQLGGLLTDADLTDEAALTYSNAVSAFRRQAEDRPRDGQVLSHLGEALARVGQSVEAEAILRRAVSIAPQDSGCWTELALFLTDRSVSALSPEKVPPELSESPELLVTKYKPSGEQFERAQKCAKEALECYDRAISLAPKDATALEHRAFGLGCVAFIQNLKQQMGASHPDLAALKLWLLTPECLPDLRRAAELDPQNPNRLATVAFVEAIAATLKAASKGGYDSASQKPWDVLDAEQAKSVRGKLNQLTELIECPSKEKAADAAKLLGLTQMIIMGDERGAEASFRRAVALNSKDAKAWEALMVTLAQEMHYHEMINVGEAWVKAVASSRSHLGLAKAHERLKHWDKVVEETQAAIKAAPNDYLAKVALISALLHVEDEKLSKETLDLLDIDKKQMKQADRELNVHGLFMCGLFFALHDQVEDARHFFQLVLKAQPDHEGTKAALAMVDSWK